MLISRENQYWHKKMQIDFDFDNVQWLEWHRSSDARLVKSEYLRLKSLFWQTLSQNTDDAFLIAKDIYMLLQGNNSWNRILILYCYQHIDYHFDHFSNLDVIEKLQAFEFANQYQPIELVIQSGYELVKTILERDCTLMRFNLYCYQLINHYDTDIGEGIQNLLVENNLDYTKYRAYELGQILYNNCQRYILTEKLEFVCSKMDLIY